MDKGKFTNDKRFAHILSDPRFKKISKSEKKLKIDKRFQSMFKDDKFKLAYSVDKRGRHVQYSTNEDLKRFYELDSEESDTEQNTDKNKTKPNLKKKSHARKEIKSEARSSSEEESSCDEEKTDKDSNSDDEKLENQVEQSEELDKLVEKYDESNCKIPKSVRKKIRDIKVDYARGEGRLLSESSSSDDTEESGDELVIEHNWGELDKDADTTDEISKRLAVCNMDWDRIRAVDLMILFNSFLPPNGIIESISIYPSEFGLERMKEEEIKGPLELTEKFQDHHAESESGSDSDENEEGSSYQMEKLRQYQLNRLKYYYAVVVCDNENTANKLYSECDGLEYESSATKVDLRFIPDDMTFEHEPREICRELPDLSKYKPRLFSTTALQQMKVNLTWDETNPDRSELVEKLNSNNLTDLNDDELHDILASSSDSDNENDESVKTKNNCANDNFDNDPIEKYKELLKGFDDKQQKQKQNNMEIEISWNVALKKKTDDLAKKSDNKDSLTPFEQYLEKRKQKKKEKKKSKKPVKNEGSNLESYSDDDVPSDIDLNDPYFAEEFKNAEFEKPKSKKVGHSKQDKPKDNTNDADTKELELLMIDENEDGNLKHFNFKKIQDDQTSSKKKKKKLRKIKGNKLDDKQATDDFKVNVNDDRFSAIYSNHMYNIDPADAHYRKTKNMETLISEKLKRRRIDDMATNKQDNSDKASSKSKTQLNLLVKSVKNKTKAHK